MSKQLWTPEEVLDRIRVLHNSGHDTAESVSQVAPKLFSAARRYFGSWGRAVEEAGIDYSAIACASRRQGAEKRSKWSRERILECIRELADRNEPLQSVVASKRYPELHAAARSTLYFSGWSNALKAAGIDTEHIGTGQRTGLAARLAKWRTELLLERIHQIIKSCHSTDETEISAMSPVLHEASIRRFGSWAEVLHAITAAGMFRGKPPRTS